MSENLLETYWEMMTDKANVLRNVCTARCLLNHIAGRSQGSASGRHYGVYEVRRDRIELRKDTLPCVNSNTGRRGWAARQAAV